VTVTFDRGPSVYINELTSPVHSIMGVPTSVAAFVGRAPGGPAGDPVQVNSWSDFERTFGGLDPEFPLSYAVYLYFQNGGAVAQIVRMLAGETPATLRLSKDIILEAASPGPAGNSLSARVDTKVAPAPGEPAPAAGAAKNQYQLTLSDGRRMERYSAVRLGTSGEQTLDSLLKRSTLVKLATPKDPDKPLALTTMPAEGTYLVPTSDTLAKGPPPEGDAKPDGDGKGDGGDDKPAGHAKAAPVPKAPPKPVLDGAPGTAGEATAPEIGDPGDPDAESKPPTGIYALARADIFNVLCLPAVSGAGYSPQALTAAARFCEQHRAMLLVDPPDGWAGETAIGFEKATTVPALSPPSHNAAVYYPNITVPRRAGEDPLVLGPSGAVAGVWAATDAARGVWKAPAGTQAALGGIGGLEAHVGDSVSGVLNPLAINVLRTFPLVGTVVWGARTAIGFDAYPDQWKYLPVRRTALFLEESLYRGTRWVVFEPNDEPLWSSIRLNVGTFMNSLFRQGAFQGSTPQEAYLVKCDHDNNPQDQIDLGIVNILVGFAPLKPAEFVVINIQQQTDQS
jgi:uncharacterized protein